jgi:hypothetical protein
MAAPQLALIAITRGNVGLLALALDLAIPPLSLLTTLVIAATALAGLAAALGSPSAMLISIGSLVGLVLGVFLSWVKVGRDILPLRSFLMVVPYMIAKLPLYGMMLSRRSASQWTRTDRDKPKGKETISRL